MKRTIWSGMTLVCVFWAALPGCHPDEDKRPLGELMKGIAWGLSALHALPAADCSFDESVTARLATATDMIRRGLVDADNFADRNKGLAPQAIYERLLREVPKHEDTVVVHGDATFDNMLIDDDGRVGFLDCGHAGRGDRHLDLSTIIADIDEHFGAQGVALFSVAYGQPRLNERKLKFFSDLYELF